MSSNLIFQWDTGDHNLIFGDRPQVNIAKVDIDAVPEIPELTMTVRGFNSLDLIDADGCAAGIYASQSVRTSAGISAHSSQALFSDTPMTVENKKAKKIAEGVSVHYKEAERIGIGAKEKTQQANTLAQSAQLTHTETDKIRQDFYIAAQQSTLVQYCAQLTHTETDKIRPALNARHTKTLPIHSGLYIDHRHGRLVDVCISIDWQQAIPPPSGFWHGELPPAPPIPVPGNGGKQNLLFDKENGYNLLFGLLSNSDSLASREAYIVTNTFSMRRESDDAAIECRDFSASIDVDSWSWSWSASIPADQQALVEPESGDPVEVIATVNGFELRLVCERMSRERKFPDTWLSVGGRGRSAWLADPYDYQRSYDNDSGGLTANQIMDEALKENGVPIGWVVNFGITDWYVPAGVWRYFGTHIDAVNRVAEAAGAYVQADPSEKILHILPRYKKMPADWGELDADIELPEDICETESVEWSDSADYNAVWVAGGADGRLDKVIKAGSAGDTPASTVTDDLMTATEATRQRGVAILADTGRKAMVSLRLPVMEETGVVMVGDVVDYSVGGITKRGINRGTSLQYSYPQLWQTLRIETRG